MKNSPKQNSQNQKWSRIEIRALVEAGHTRASIMAMIPDADEQKRIAIFFRTAGGQNSVKSRKKK